MAVLDAGSLSRYHKGNSEFTTPNAFKVCKVSKEHGECVARHGVPDYFMITTGKHITVRIITLE